MKMELLVNQMVAWAHTVERAMHDPGPWSFRTTGGITPAHRMVDRVREEIVFIGLARRAEDGIVELWSGDEFVFMTMTDLTREEKLTWKLSLKQAAPAC